MAFAALRHLRVTALVQMRPEERQAALPGEIRTRLVVAGALVAAETVLRAGIDEHLDVRPLRLDDLDIGQAECRCPSRRSATGSARWACRRRSAPPRRHSSQPPRLILSALSRRHRRCCRRDKSRQSRPGRRLSPHRSPPACHAASPANPVLRRISAPRPLHRANSRIGSSARCDRRSRAR